MPQSRLRERCRRAVLFSLLPVAMVAAAAWGASPRPTVEALTSSPQAWPASSVVAIGKVRTGVDGLASAGNILAAYWEPSAPALRVSLVAPVGIRDRVNHFERGRVQVIALLDEAPGGRTDLPAPLRGEAPFGWERMVVLDRADGAPARQFAAKALGAADARDLLGSAAIRAKGEALDRFGFHLADGWLAAALPAEAAGATRLALFTVSGARELDRLVTATTALPTYRTNVAWVHHGNQGLSYSDVFYGRSGAEHASGFDEILEAHQYLPRIPGNFHLSALLQSAAEWDARNGNPLDFNAWLRAGVTEGWAGMMASAYGQPIMPFLQDAMNEWAVDRDVAMVSFRYGYTPRVGWVPERVWLNPGNYPGNGVIDESRDHWTNHGIDAVILDDSPHGNGYDKNQIHTLAGSSLKVILRDGHFTGRMHDGDGAGALQILTDLANNPVGPYRIVVYADDWEMAAEVAGWESTFPFALDAYEFMLGKCRTESAWLSTWKLADALSNPDFNGSGSMNVTYGTYGSIGGGDGYGGSNNAWYGHYAGFVPYSTGGDGNGGCGGGGNCKNHGQLWNDAHAALQAAPSNSIREAGWYVLMSNLHETGWHDYLGGPLSGWQRQYAAHIKNANVYAEAARWAGGLYAGATGCFFSDPDNDGVNEIVMHNDRLFGVFESIGGRLTHLFAKGADYAYPVIGCDNVYWASTEGDYNEVNHVAGLSDVGPNYQHDPYGMTVDVSSGSTVKATFTRGGLRKTISLTQGQPYLDCVYRVGASTQYVQSGFSPDLVDLVYNGEMDRIWGGGPQTYMGYRNPNTNATAAYVLGAGGATFNLSQSRTLMKLDEISGSSKFRFLIYGGYASAPNGSGQVAELQALASGLTDALAPEAASGTFFPATRQLALTFDEAVRWNEVVVTKIALDDDDDGAPEVTLDAGTVVLTNANAATLTLQTTVADRDSIAALNRTNLRLLLQSAAVKDVAGNPNAVLTNQGDVMVSYGPPTLVTLDGRFDPSEWPTCAVAVADSFDTAWGSGNEIQALYATWDSTYLYLGIRGVATANSWLLYLDTDPGGPNGQVDLRAIDNWERGVQFTAPGFRADWQFGAYQHQGPFDSQSFYKITSATTTLSYSDSVLKAFDPNHQFGLNGGSEIAIPWSALYDLGPGLVPANAQLGLVATLCWDPEPSGEAGGDQAPSNTGGVLPPTLNNRHLVVLDANGDGRPDLVDRAPPALVAATPTGWDSVITLTFDEPLAAVTAHQASRYAVYRTANPAQTLTVRAATLLPGATQVRLLVSPMSYVGYTVVASGVADSSCFRNASAQTSATFQGPPVAVDESPSAAGLELRAPLPHPAAGRAAIEFALPAASADVRLDLFDMSGRHVRRLAAGPHAAGVHRVAFDVRDARGRATPPGVYFLRLADGRESRARRFVIVSR